MSFLSRLLGKNIPVARVVGFGVSCFMGLVIICGAVQFYCDSRNLLDGDDNFINSDMIVINKKVTSSSVFGNAGGGFSDREIEEIRQQPWVRRVGKFRSADFEVRASIGSSGNSLHTMLFFESVPDEFIDIDATGWSYVPGGDVPVIISKDYVSLYNFGFASSSSMPQMSEQLMSGIPLTFALRSNHDAGQLTVGGHIAGFSSRLNTILVPESFMNYANSELGGNQTRQAQRLIIDVSSPGDTVIEDFLDSHGYEKAGARDSGRASYFLKVISGVVGAIGFIITVLSLLIMLLGISLIMEKSRSVIHTLLQLGYEPSAIAGYYARVAVVTVVGALVVAEGVVAALRVLWIEPLHNLGAVTPGICPSLLTGAVVCGLLVVFNLITIRRKVRGAWR